MTIDIVGEDLVTQTIAQKLITIYRPDLIVGSIHPVRGAQIKTEAPKFNRLGLPVFLLADQDNSLCAPQLITDWLGEEPISSTMLFRIADWEAEVWLMADRKGFAKWMGISAELIPQAIKGNLCKDGTRLIELPFKYKPSLFMMRELASQSSKQELKDKLTPGPKAGKSPAYNSALLPFITNIWNAEAARQSSTSLNKAILRLQAF